MIVRIVGEGQWEVPESELGDLNVIDAKVEKAVDDADQSALTAALTELVNRVRTHGEPVSEATVTDSDLIIPDISSTRACSRGDRRLGAAFLGNRRYCVGEGMEPDGRPGGRRAGGGARCRILPGMGRCPSRTSGARRGFRLHHRRRRGGR